ncbi:MAG: NADH-quinone oxidoreductase subunit N, partial [Bryobacterales bacterium]|nr:NADH-quinone oxidoreductase subunit N [Bryobacterales bacterium]
MADNFMPSAAEMLRFLPETVLIVFGTLIMLLDALAGEGKKGWLGTVAIVGLLLAAWGTVVAWSNPGPAFQSMLMVDGYATFFRFLVITVGVLTVLASVAYLKREKADSGEYYALVLYSIAGQCVMVTANELIMIFIGLEISSISSYILAGYLRDDKRNNESALKYFLLGSFATAFLLYGIAWIYGATGTTNLADIRRVLSNRDIAPALGLIGTSAALMFVGFAFKVSAAPFQVWAPDVYQGAPAPVSAFLSAGPKAAAFAIFLRVFMTAFEPVADKWAPVIWVSALATMTVGNFAALLQSNIKRLLAYSSIAHAGYVMVAIAAHSQIGTEAVMFYMAAYAFMNVGA